MTEQNGVERSTATETFRAMLDERGVEWDEYGDGYTLLRHGGREYTVQPNVCNRLIVTNLTPEQAIAATLGAGTLTAEQVSNATYAHSIHADCADADWQAIANELNATLGRGTCTDTGHYCFTCSECGWAANEPHHAFGGFWPNYCPNCGRRCVG